jgi:hypothetical protein
VDALLGRFLARVRPRTRPSHLAIYEDVVVALDDYLQARRRRAASLRPADLDRFLGHWVVCTGRVPERRARRFCAAFRVLIGDLARQIHTTRAAPLQRAVVRVARATSRAARAAELLDDAGATFTDEETTDASAGSEFLDGYWVVVLRGTSHAVVRALGTRALVGPVLLPAAVLRFLDPGAVINMCIVPVGQHWCVLEHGPCYPSAALPALRGASQPVPA